MWNLQRFTRVNLCKRYCNFLDCKIDGKGGGRTEFAQGAGKPVSKSKFVSSIPNIIESLAERQTLKNIIVQKFGGTSEANRENRTCG